MEGTKIHKVEATHAFPMRKKGTGLYSSLIEKRSSNEGRQLLETDDYLSAL